ncbi:MAG: hypothetical protein PHR52_12860 [Fermentimonas sp.]|nr:hypothetical protein [Fermentimonas sp.]
MWTLQQFEKVYERYQASGLRIKEFCRNESIVESKFYYWQKKLREHNYRTGRQPGFVPIVFTGSTPSPTTREVVHHQPVPEHVDPTAGNVFEIVYPNGVKVRVPMGADPTQLRSLILLTQ